MIFYTVFDVNSVLKQTIILAPYLFYVDTLIRSNDLIFKDSRPFVRASVRTSHGFSKTVHYFFLKLCS